MALKLSSHFIEERRLSQEELSQYWELASVGGHQQKIVSYSVSVVFCVSFLSSSQCHCSHSFPLEWNEMRILGPKCIVFNHWVLYKDKCLLSKTQDWLNSNLVNGWSSKVKLSKFSLAQAGHYPLQKRYFVTRCYLTSLALIALISLFIGL